MVRGNKERAWTYQEYVDEFEKLKVENEKLKAKLLLATSQNYCKICGNILDGYVPPKGKNEY